VQCSTLPKRQKLGSTYNGQAKGKVREGWLGMKEKLMKCKMGLCGAE
jgi:hypothetical protein